MQMSPKGAGARPRTRGALGSRQAAVGGSNIRQSGRERFRVVEPLDAVTAYVPPVCRVEGRGIRLRPDRPRTVLGVITR